MIGQSGSHVAATGHRLAEIYIAELLLIRVFSMILLLGVCVSSLGTVEEGG